MTAGGDHTGRSACEAGPKRAAELLIAAETGGVRIAEDILKHDSFADANREIAPRSVKICTVCLRGAQTLKRRRS